MPTTKTLEFTRATIDRLPVPPRHDTAEYFDARQAGLSLRVHPTGKKTFCLHYRLKGERKNHRLTLGYYPDRTIAKARELALRGTRQASDGIDPNPKHQALAPPPVTVVTFSQLAQRYIDIHVPKKKSGWKDIYWINKVLLPRWADVPVGNIRRRDVADLLNEIAARPARRSSDIVRSLISRMFRIGIAQGFEDIEYNPAQGTERALAYSTKRTRVPTMAEFGRLWAVWESFIEDGRKLLGWQFQLRALTAQRGGEVLQLQWSTVDLDTTPGRWVKPFEIRKRKRESQHKNPFLIPLAPMAVSILRKLKEYHEQELNRKNALYGGTWNGEKWGWPREGISDFAFPSRRNPEEGATNFWAEEVKEMASRAKVDDFRPHDLRRWASTNANAIVENPFWVERYFDHEIGGVAGVYNLNQYVEQKTYVAYAIENKVREAIGMKPIRMPARPMS
jgi:integrase